MFYMLRSVICGWNVTEEVKTACTPELLEKTVALAKHHDLVHLVGQAIANWKLPESEIGGKAKQFAMDAFCRYMRIDHEYRRLCQILEEAKTPFIPLKGLVIRAHYPEAWMRTSCDIDILVKKEQLEQTSQLLQEKAGYRYVRITPHDVDLDAPNGVHLELHYDTIEDAICHEAQEILSKVWETAVPVRTGAYQMVMPEEMFYYYHVAHMAKHFQNGGCGVRPFLDLWIMDNRMEHDLQARHSLMERGGMWAFWEASEKLSRAWFSDGQLDEMGRHFARFTLTGGTFGSMEGQVMIRQKQSGGKLQYIFSRLFLSYEVIKFEYPILMKHKWLTPFYQVRRWFKLLRKDSRQRTAQQLQTADALDRQAQENTRGLMNYLGLE